MTSERTHFRGYEVLDLLAHEMEFSLFPIDAASAHPHYFSRMIHIAQKCKPVAVSAKRHGMWLQRVSVIARAFSGGSVIQ